MFEDARKRNRGAKVGVDRFAAIEKESKGDGLQYKVSQDSNEL